MIKESKIVSVRLSKTEILDRFRACCQNLGKTPGSTIFCKTAGVKLGDVYHYWPRFTDLSKEAGGVSPGWSTKIPESVLFEEYAKVCLHLGKIPTLPELRITTRELKTRTHSVKRHCGTIAEFDRLFRQWLEKQAGDIRRILNFPGWDRKNNPMKQEKVQRAPLTSQSFHPYLPYSLQSLDALANGNLPRNDDSTQSVSVLFEQRCSDAFRCLGFEITSLGQGKGRMADCLAAASRERFALIIDAKVRRDGYVLGTEDRKFLEYALNHGKDLQAKGFEKIYLVIVAPVFQERDLEKLTKYLSDSPIRSVTLLSAKALMRIVENSIRERHSFALSDLEELFFGNKVIDE